MYQGLYYPGRIFLSAFLLLLSLAVKAQPLQAFAGADKTICPGGSATLGGAPAALGGLPPYTYAWNPSTALSSTSNPNPISTPSSNIIYTLTVTDDTGAVAQDYVDVNIAYISQVNAGYDTSICERSYALLGNLLNVAGAGVTYSWSPGGSLNDSTLPRPLAMPTATTSYTLTASMPGCTDKIDVVTVTIIPTPPIDAGSDTTIKSGSVAVLNASGGFNYIWTPQDATITYPFTEHPDVEPTATETYYLFGTDASNKCPGYDSVTVTVELSSDIVIYNTFTPNNDGENDTWYIGNILKYPDNQIEIYNRNGRLLYKTSNYINDWDGKAFGEELPAATYFYVIDLGNNMGVFHGTLTIIK
jgi:gliding motility-associated-like protein